MDDMPIHITRIRVVGELYEVLYNGQWEWMNTYDQIKDMAWNFCDVEDVLNYHERRKKIGKIMNLDKKIYSNGVIYQKNDY